MRDLNPWALEGKQYHQLILQSSQESPLPSPLNQQQDNTILSFSIAKRTLLSFHSQQLISTNFTPPLLSSPSIINTNNKTIF
jgi:hypothetical protein